MPTTTKVPTLPTEAQHLEANEVLHQAYNLLERLVWDIDAWRKASEDDDPVEGPPGYEAVGPVTSSVWRLEQEAEQIRDRIAEIRKAIIDIDIARLEA